MTNKYRLPFVPFVGITGHAQTCLFGCAFLHDETAETFKWVFETFLESMGGKHPRSIITDQDKAMKAAIPEVFPNTRHRNCLFHIKNKGYNKNLKVFGLYEIFEDTVNNCLSEEEFEYLWGKMIEDKKLENNKYFTRMWETRERFIQYTTNMISSRLSKPHQEVRLSMQDSKRMWVQPIVYTASSQSTNE